MALVPEGGRWAGGLEHYSQSYGRLHRNGLARTITTAFPNAGSGRFWHPTENRALTLREAARLQGFPDSFHFVPPFSRAAFLVGNALDKTIADLVFEVIRGCLE
jgi:DNA (cytosine-5)-methyltransferase 1